MFEHFEHKADIGVRGVGETKEKAFEECAKAFTSVMAKLASIEPRKSHVINLSSKDDEALLVAFLNELLFLKDTKKMLYSQFRVTLAGDGVSKLKAVCFGEKVGAKKQTLLVEVKAATYTELAVKKEGNNWVAQCVVDV